MPTTPHASPPRRRPRPAAARQRPPRAPTSTTTTAVPGPVCDSAGPLTLIADALSTARLPVPACLGRRSRRHARSPNGRRPPTSTPHGSASTAASSSPPPTRTDQRLAIARLDRAAHGVRESRPPLPPSDALPAGGVRAQSRATEGRGEFLAGDMSLVGRHRPRPANRSCWAMSTTASAPRPRAGRPGRRLPFEEEINLGAGATRHRRAGRQPACATPGSPSPPELGSEEGYAQFVSASRPDLGRRRRPDRLVRPHDAPATTAGDTIHPGRSTGPTCASRMPNPDDNLGLRRGPPRWPSPATSSCGSSSRPSTAPSTRWSRRPPRSSRPRSAAVNR